MKQQYVIKNKRGPLPSKSNGGAPYWIITFEGRDDKLSYTTYVDTSMENFDQWNAIIGSKDQLILSGLKLKSAKDRLINGDSVPEICGSIAPKPTAKYVEPASNTFGSLFE